MQYSFNPFTGKLDSVGAGSGGSSAVRELVGSAVIVRDVDTLYQGTTYTPLFKNCSYESLFGDCGAINISTGKITIPTGATFVRFHASDRMEGYTGRSAMRISSDILEQSITNGVDLCVSQGEFDFTFYVGIAGATEVWLNMYPNGPDFVFTTSPLDRYTAFVEFYG